MNDGKTWVLADAEMRIWVETFELTHEDVDLGTAAPWSVRKQRLHGGLADGVDIIEVSNGPLAFVVVPTRGMGIWRGSYEDCALGWDAPVNGPVNPMFVNALERGGLGWLQGFDEWIVRCGLASNGAPGRDVVLDNNGNPAEVDLTLHGKIANTPAHRVEVRVTPGEPAEIAVIGVVDESMLFCPQFQLRTTISTSPGSNALTVFDEVTNMQAVDAELELLYHCNFGPPFLEQGAQLVAPAREIAPRDARAADGIGSYDTYAGPTPGYVEQVYWYDLNTDGQGNTLAMLRNAAGDKGAVLRYHKEQLPWFTQWKNTAAASDGYVTGLEPGTNLPNLKTFEREKGRVVTLPPGGTYESRLVAEVCSGRDAVSAVEAEIAAIQGGNEPTVHALPVPVWSAL